MSDRIHLPTSGPCVWPAIWLVAAAALCAGAVPRVAVGGDDAAPSVEEWPARCEALREDFSAHAGLDVLLSERPERGVGSDQVWILEWQGVAFPVPKADYDSLGLSLPTADAPADASLMLHGPSGAAVGAFVFPMFEPMDDAFATLDPSGALRESLGGQGLSQALWGGPVSMAELERRGYQTTPDDLTCTLAAWRDDAARTVALALKQVGPGRVTHAYPVVGWDRPTTLLRRDRDGVVHWSATPPLADAGDDGLVVDVIHPKRPDLPPFGLAIGPAEGADDHDAPPWLRRLQAVLDDDTPAAWRELLDAMEQADFDQRSRKRVERTIERRFD